MGVIGRLLTLPLAPAQGLVWVLGQVAEQAEAEAYGEAGIRRRLAAAELALELGEIGEEEYEAIEEELLALLTIARGWEESP